MVVDQLFFEPAYQNGTYSTIFTTDSVPNQCGSNTACVTLNQWQTWNALQGGWWSGNESAGGPPLISIAAYVNEHPDATIVNTETGKGGLRIATGCGGGAWTNFIGNADNLVISAQGRDTVKYDFELYSTPANADECKNGGWMRFNSPDGRFKNQGQCVSSVNSKSAKH
ncbi:MAG: hypothetical protein QOJ70_888 [Acidobacteriota bacterium]|jgi:hypothetical protein|nr:hypothetical protein [Acidobacteriota bacterium]